jgi:hydrogenase expression/formation protein HypE
MSESLPSMQGPVCPVPLQHTQKIVMGHGSGGKMMQDLIARTFLPPFENPVLKVGDDAGVVNLDNSTQLVISIDSHVVWPLFFPGGDIGKLAICGTVNDVAMMGAKPLYITVGFILEEGLEMPVLERVLESMKYASLEAGIQIIAGDTKVVQKGKADGLYVTTAGVGVRSPKLCISGTQAKPGDKVILSGTIGDHGIAVLGARGELGFEAEIQSDIAPLNKLVDVVLNTAETEQVHAFRDPTRGGLASALNEISNQSNVGIVLDEQSIPVKPAVSAACELLGFDPLYVANEGKFIAMVSSNCAESVLMAMRNSTYGKDAVIIGEVVNEHPGRVLMRTAIGSTRIVDTLSGEILPRIC